MKPLKLIQSSVFATVCIFLSSGAFAEDSTNVSRPNLDKITVKAPTTKTHAAVITNQGWPTTDCPATPTGCPTINDDPDANPSSCPSLCKVSQGAYDASKPNTAMQNASCPAGYTQIGQFNSQPEYAYSASTTYKYPKTMYDYENYKDLSYNCYGDGDEKEYRTSCRSGTGNDHGSEWDKGDYTDEMPNAPDRVVYLFRDPFQRCSTAGSHCSDNFSISCGVSGSWQWRYHYKYVTCSRPPGNYATGRYIPASVACARITPTWQ